MSAATPEPVQFDNTGDKPLQVPGIGLPLLLEIEYEPRSGHICFENGIGQFSQTRLLAREVAMLAVMNNITDRPNWHKNVFDEEIVDKWRAEATAMPLISAKSWDWLLRELQDKTKFLDKHGFVTALDTASVCAKADGLVDDSLRDELMDGVRPLLAVDDMKKDWQPNSRGQVLNLVHPSMFPLVYGRTQVLNSGRVGLLNCFNQCGQGTIPPRQSLQRTVKMHSVGMRRIDHRFSNRFQWLPAEIQFKPPKSGSQDVEVEITSYINNLHPVQHQALYSTISKIIGKAIPMWNEILVKLWDGRIPPRIRAFGAECTATIPEHLNGLWISRHDEDFDKVLQQVIEYLALPDRNDYDASQDDEEDEPYKDGTWKDGELRQDSLDSAVRWKYKRINQAIHPDPGAGPYGFSYDEWKFGRCVKTHENSTGSKSSVLGHEYYHVRLEEDFRERGLQVIVKLASVELTPDNPSYDGGSWDLEGMLNEHIVATAIYFYDIENITESLIEFRTAADLDESHLDYAKNEHGPLEQVFGAKSLHGEPAIQQLGSLNCKPNRLLAFPNTLHHRVQPFSLADPSRPGCRRFLVLWLVDPHYRIASTANVPPQQHDWLAPLTIDKVLAKQGMAAELEDMIKQHTDDYPMSLDTAKKLRLELMEERTKLMPHVENSIVEYHL